MPMYEYEILSPDGSARGVLEVEQKMSDPPLLRHPETGETLRRVLSATFGRVASESSSARPASYGGCAGGVCGLD
jgi:predicted nucleic acid-binding Zn ribbon protein